MTNSVSTWHRERLVFSESWGYSFEPQRYLSLNKRLLVRLNYIAKEIASSPLLQSKHCKMILKIKSTVFGVKFILLFQTSLLYRINNFISHYKLNYTNPKFDFRDAKLANVLRFKFCLQLLCSSCLKALFSTKV